MTSTLRITRRGVGGLALGAIAAARPARSQTGQNYVGRLSHNKPVEEPFHIAITRSAERMAQRSGGRLQLKVFPNAQLGAELQAAESVSTGAIEFAVTSPGGLGTFVPPFGAFIAPYAFDSWAQVRHVVDGPLGQDLNRQLAEKSNMIALEYYNDGWRHILTRTKPIHTVDDLKGVKIRVSKNKLFIETFRAFGCAPVALDFPEVYSAVGQGVADGCEFSIPILLAAKLYEVGKQLSLTYHMITPIQVVVNAGWYHALPADLRTILDSELRNASEDQLRIIEEGERVGAAELQSKGVAIVEHPELAGFREAAAAVPKIMASDWGPGFWEELQKAKRNI